MAKRGRPTVRVTVRPSERTTLEQWARATDHGERLGPVRADRLGMRSRPIEFGGGDGPAHHPADGRALASSLRREALGWAR